MCLSARSLLPSGWSYERYHLQKPRFAEGVPFICSNGGGKDDPCPKFCVPHVHRDADLVPCNSPGHCSASGQCVQDKAIIVIVIIVVVIITVVMYLSLF